MLLKRHILDGIAEGKITMAFRRWKRPTVKTGGTLRTVIGLLAIESVDKIDEGKITKRDAKQAGFESKEELLAELNTRREGTLYRIVLGHAGSDPRIDLRQQATLSRDELADVKKRLANMDSRSSSGPWTLQTLKLIKQHPGKRAPDLAASIGMETKRFKGNVRKLKELGLTESLAVGYRLSPRGEVVLKKL